MFRRLVIALCVAHMGCSLETDPVLPRPYSDHPSARSCRGTIEPVRAGRAEVFWEAQHGPILGWQVQGRTVDLEIAEGIPNPVPDLLLRTDDVFVDAEVVFDGWRISRSRCATLVRDIYFVRQFHKASAQPLKAANSTN
jgi:hypothetical protein